MKVTSCHLICRIISKNENDVKELEITNNIIENLQIYDNYYAEIYAEVGGSFRNYLKSASDVLIQKNGR